MSIGYRELATELRGELERGTWEPGATLPKQDELAEQYGVNIKTVRSAVGLLEAEGLVTAVRRRGTVVRQRPPMRRLGVERYARSRWKFNDVVAFAADREEAGRAWKPTDQTQTVRKLEASPKVAEALGVEVGSPVYARARLVRDQETPTHTLASYYRPEDVDGTPLVDSTPGPAGRGGGFAVLTMQGLEPREISESFHARMPTPDEVDELELPTGEPVMVLDRITRTDAGRVIEYARGVRAASRFSWSYTFDVPD